MMSMTDFQSKDRVCTVTIADDQTESAVVDLGGLRPVLIGVPADFEGTSLSFQVATSETGTFGAVRDADNQPVSLNVTAGDFVRVEPSQALGLRYVKLVADMAQTGTASLQIIAFPF